ncbi:Tellurite resistance protein TerB, partial [Hydrocoleum sp. CS-953]|uniref:tellurite resistance TerB family protein n=1 Tax=Hydrocoleum sp. CS-953 TaxID=1671698 RepID=UPI000BDC7E2E
MGLFDGLRKSKSVSSEITLGPAESFTAIMLVVVSADGYLSDAEADLLSTVLGRMQLFRSYPSEVMRRMFDKLCGVLKKQGNEALINAALNS